MNVDEFLDEIRSDPGYAGHIVYVHEIPARRARYADPGEQPGGGVKDILARIDIERLYSH